jgi:chemotaxis protein MotA
MDILSLLGLALALVAIFGGTILKGSGIAALWSGAAFVIVIVGTLAATLLQTPMAVMMRALKISVWVVKPPPLHGDEFIEKIIEWSQTARKQGLLGLEPHVETEPDPFVSKALQLVVDGSEPETIRNIMEVDIMTREEADQNAAKVFESLGIYAPTLGIIGAVMGLIAVMQNLADPEYLGRGIAVAFVATIYGIGSANLAFLPMAGKLKNVVRQQSQIHEMIVEGLVSIAEGENPRNIETKLKGFVQ